MFEIEEAQTLSTSRREKLGVDTRKDATDDFEDVEHISSARAMLNEYYVGDIDSLIIITKVKYTPPKSLITTRNKTTKYIIKILQFVVPLINLSMVVDILFYTKQYA